MPTTRPSLVEAVSRLDLLDWLSGRVEKATKKPGLPSILTEDGFIRQVVREALLLRAVTEKEVSDPALKRQLARSLTIDWKGASDKEIRRAVGAAARLIEGMPSRFAPGARVILDTQAKKVIQDTHQELGKKHKIFGVDPVFSLRNQQAVDALTDTTSMFFGAEYSRQAERFGERAQRVIASGLADGLGRTEIAAALGKEFNEAAINANYWETVAAVHVSRARSFSSMTTYAESGVTEYEIVAMQDERTTQICQFMDGKTFSVEAALNTFDKVEGAKDLDQLKSVTPLMSMRGGEIMVGSQTVRGAGGTMSDKELNAAGIGTPPFHHRCRSTVVPVIAAPSKTPPPPKEPEGEPDAPPPKPEDDRSLLRSANTPAEASAAMLKEVERSGFIPGEARTHYDLLPTVSYDLELKERMPKKEGLEMYDAMSKQFLARGMAIVDSDPGLKKDWKKIKEDDGYDFYAKDDFAMALRKKLENMGANSFTDQKERIRRRDAFVKDVLKITKAGDYGWEKNSPTKPLDEFQKKDVEKWATSYFNAWGPLAEAAIKQNKTAVVASGRAWNNYGDRMFTFYDERTFHHELTHSVENHIMSPRDSKSKTAPNPPSHPRYSYWWHRVHSRHKGKPVSLRRITGNSGYRTDEKTRKDKWHDVYAGKIYYRGSTEVLTTFAEAFGGGLSNWITQLAKDPEALIEWIGFMEAAIQGEHTRRRRGGVV